MLTTTILPKGNWTKGNKKSPAYVKLGYNAVMLSNFKLKTPIAILGFGIEGKAALEFLRSQGFADSDITICDENKEFKIPDELKAPIHSSAENAGKHDNPKLCLGKNAFIDLSGFRTIFRSPGVRYNLPSIREAHELGAQVTSLTKLTLELAADRITAITGTNGKTTTTALCEQILAAHYGDRLIVGGNDRTPILKQALANHPSADHPSADPTAPILMEISSFQFADLKHSPYIAAVLNITPNHLDWHENMQDYINAKMNILRHQKPSDWALLNAADENSAKLAPSTHAQLFWINDRRGDNWAVWEDGYLRLSFGGKIATLLHFDQLNIKTHPDNILFAAAIAYLHNIPPSTIEEQIKLFKGVEHRLELVRTLNDVHFYNDSSSTSPESAMAAIDQFIPKKLILLLGGSTKNADFSELAKSIVKQGVRVYLYGQEKVRLHNAIVSNGGEHLILNSSEKSSTNNLRQIVEDVQQLANIEDSIVLSPACASFDMFKNAKHRGEEFKEIVMWL